MGMNQKQAYLYAKPLVPSGARLRLSTWGKESKFVYAILIPKFDTSLQINKGGETWKEAIDLAITEWNRRFNIEGK